MSMTIGGKTYQTLDDFETQVIRVPRKSKDMVLIVQFIDEPAPQPIALEAGAYAIDVSENQSVIEWPMVKQFNPAIKAAFIRAATYERNQPRADRYFAANWAGAKDAGLPRGAYVWVDPRAEVKAQSDFFITLMGSSWGELPPTVDVELDGIYGGNRERFTAGLREMLRAVELASGSKPQIYTSQLMWGKLTTQPDWGANYDLWVSNPLNVGVKPTGRSPRLPATWAAVGATWWQWSWTETVPGIKTNVDCNIKLRS